MSVACGQADQWVRLSACDFLLVFNSNRSPKMHRFQPGAYSGVGLGRVHLWAASGWVWSKKIRMFVRWVDVDCTSRTDRRTDGWTVCSTVSCLPPREGVTMICPAAGAGWHVSVTSSNLDVCRRDNRELVSTAKADSHRHARHDTDRTVLSCLV